MSLCLRRHLEGPYATITCPVSHRVFIEQPLYHRRIKISANFCDFTLFKSAKPAILVVESKAIFRCGQGGELDYGPISAQHRIGNMELCPGGQNGEAQSDETDSNYNK
jgi:hypothetical protein